MVFVESEVDKRNKLYKKVKDNGYAAELKKQDADQLMRWAAGILAKDGKRSRARSWNILWSGPGMIWRISGWNWRS